MKFKAACGENSIGFTNKQSSQVGFLARIAFSDDLLDQKSKFPLFPGGGGPLLQMTSTYLPYNIAFMCIFSCSRSRMSLNGAKCNILLCIQRLTCVGCAL